MAAAAVAPPAFRHRDLPKSCFYLDQIVDRRCPISQIDNNKPPAWSLGSLSVLPAELLTYIIEPLSLLDLMRFRKSCRATHNFVDTLPKFSLVLRHAPNVITGMIATRATASTQMTLSMLYEKLGQRVCDHEEHDDLAQYIHVPTGQRLCKSCCHPVGVFPTFEAPIHKYDAALHYAMTNDDLDGIPSFRFLPATFRHGNHKLKVEGAHTFYDAASVKQRCLELTGSDDPSMSYSDNYVRCDRDDTHTAILNNTSTKPTLTIENMEPPRILTKHMSIVFAPWFTPGSSTVEEGVYCASCLCVDEGFEELFEPADFQEHLGDCRVTPLPVVVEANRKYCYDGGFLLDDEDDESTDRMAELRCRSVSSFNQVFSGTSFE
ncbi:hypothetical protein BDV96DRAFT_640284 [Lophiotrema nucula]|uniref:F-box domain-containing protein n=1 Tax=Lophiotrema nucula TaxID=690887 RepID=A0A6A5ZTR6_9PLEO|nr:hypothetical protein BDV96DRAFT_640284 [Lophiotrema nucula]